MTPGRAEDEAADAADDQPELSDLSAELEALESVVNSPEAREQVRETVWLTVDVATPEFFGQAIRGLIGPTLPWRPAQFDNG